MLRFDVIHMCSMVCVRSHAHVRQMKLNSTIANAIINGRSVGPLNVNCGDTNAIFTALILHIDLQA